MMTRRIVMQWNLRQVMAARGIQTSDLVPLLAERDIHLSRQFVHRLVTKTPQRVNMDVLAALCDILDFQPNDVLQPVVETVKVAKTGGSDARPGIGDLRPIRAKIPAWAKGHERPGDPPADHVCPLRSGGALLPADPGGAGVQELRVAVRTNRHDLPGMLREQGFGVLRRATQSRLSAHAQGRYAGSRAFTGRPRPTVESPHRR